MQIHAVQQIEQVAFGLCSYAAGKIRSFGRCSKLPRSVCLISKFASTSKADSTRTEASDRKTVVRARVERCTSWWKSYHTFWSCWRTCWCVFIDALWPVALMAQRLRLLRGGEGADSIMAHCKRRTGRRSSNRCLAPPVAASVTTATTVVARSHCGGFILCGPAAVWGRWLWCVGISV